MGAETIATIGATAVAVVFSIWGLGWWLRGKFQEIKDYGDKRWLRVSQMFTQKVDDHENQDQQRHEDNLNRFMRIEVALAQLGWRNGKVAP